MRSVGKVNEPRSSVCSTLHDFDQTCFFDMLKVTQSRSARQGRGYACTGYRHGAAFLELAGVKVEHDVPAPLPIKWDLYI